MKEVFEQRVIGEAKRSTIVAPVDRMRDPIRFVAIQKMNASGITHHVIATAAPFDEKTRPRKDEHLSRRFLFRAKGPLGRAAGPVGNGHEPAGKER